MRGTQTLHGSFATRGWWWTMSRSDRLGPVPGTDRLMHQATRAAARSPRAANGLPSSVCPVEADDGNPLVPLGRDLNDAFVTPAGPGAWPWKPVARMRGTPVEGVGADERARGAKPPTQMPQHIGRAAAQLFMAPRGLSESHWSRDAVSSIRKARGRASGRHWPRGLF